MHVAPGFVEQLQQISAPTFIVIAVVGLLAVIAVEAWPKKPRNLRF